MVGIDDERSKKLFNRHASLAIFTALGALPKDEFEPKDLQLLTGATKDDIGRELARLIALGCVGRVGRAGSGRYQRLPTAFWQVMSDLNEEWDGTIDAE